MCMYTIIPKSGAHGLQNHVSGYTKDPAHFVYIYVCLRVRACVYVCVCVYQSVKYVPSHNGSIN